VGTQGGLAAFIFAFCIRFMQKRKKILKIGISHKKFTRFSKRNADIFAVIHIVFIYL